MKNPVISTPPITVNPTSTALWSERVLDWDGAAFLVKNTGSEVISVWIETRLLDTGIYARRPVDDLVAIPPGEAKQFDADISMSRWAALVGTSAGAGSTAEVEIGLTQGGRPW